MGLLFCQVHGWTEIVWCSFWHLKSLRECCSDLLVCQESVQTRPLPGQISSVIPMAENSIFWEPPSNFGGLLAPVVTWWPIQFLHPGVTLKLSHQEAHFPRFRIVDFEGTHEKPNKPTCRDKTLRHGDAETGSWTYDITLPNRGWKTSFHYKLVIFRVYVNLPEGKTFAWCWGHDFLLSNERSTMTGGQKISIPRG